MFFSGVEESVSIETRMLDLMQTRARRYLLIPWQIFVSTMKISDCLDWGDGQLLTKAFATQV